MITKKVGTLILYIDAVHFLTTGEIAVEDHRNAVIREIKRVLDIRFPDNRRYIGKNYKFCDTNYWGEPCHMAQLDKEKGVYVCTEKRSMIRKGDCTNAVLDPAQV